MLTKKSAKTLLLLFLLPFLMASSCHKKKVVPTYYMDQEFKDYCLFPLGSYWVYQDSLNNKDSIYLFRQDVEVIQAGHVYDYNHEDFNQSSTSSFFHDSLYGGGGVDEVYNGKVNCVFYERSFSNLLVVNPQFISDQSIGYIFTYNQSIKTEYIKYYDSININGILYKKVKVFQNLYEEAANQPQKIFYASKVGVIRKELFNGQVWNLIRYHIN